jgi:hypothetical protein
MRRNASEWLLWHPYLDATLPFASLLLLLAPDPTKALDNLYMALSTLAGIVLATITFTSSFIYSSNTKLMRIVQEKFKKPLLGNVIGMIVFTLLAAFLPLISILLDESKWSLILALASAIIVVQESLRCIFWIRYTLFMNVNSVRYESDGYDTKQAQEAIRHRPVHNPKMMP